MAPTKIKKGRGILPLLLNPYGFAQSSFQDENRKGRVLGL